MADKRISQLIERVDIANNDVLPIVASGATTTNKVTISTIQDWMQENLDVGVTSVGITLGTWGTDVNVSGSPITTSGNITINIPDASASARGVVTTGSQVFGGVKTFANGLSLPAVGGSNQVTRIVNIGTLHEGTASLNQIGFNSGNNIYFGKGLNNGGVISWNNSTVRYYTLPDADGTIALASQLDGYVTLNTDQTITGEKTFNNRVLISNSGAYNALDIFQSSGSGIAVDISKAGNGEGLRVAKTSGSGNAVTITGGLLLTEGVSVNTPANAIGLLLNGRAADNVSQIRFGSNTGAGQYNSISANASSLDISSLGNTPITFSTDTQGSGGTRMTISGTGAVTLTGALNGTTASFNNLVNITASGGGAAINIRGRSVDDLGQILFFDNNGSTLRNIIQSQPSSLAIYSQGNTPITFGTNTSGGGGTRMTIQGDGTVAIAGALNGTSASFSGGFELNNTGTGALGFFGANNTTDKYIRIRNSSGNFEMGTSSSEHYLLGNGGIPLKFYTNGTPRLTLDASTGAATFSSSVTAANNITCGTGAFDTGGFFLSYSSSSASSRNWKIANDQQVFGDFSIKQSSTQTGLPDTTRFYIDASGNVGIGTASPTTYSLAGRHLEVNDAGGGYSFIHNNTTSVKSFFAANESGSLAALFTFSNHPLTFGTNNTERMRITSDTAAFLRMASGTGGIQFNGDTAAANALDDYEEGTWTPTSVSGGLPFSIQAARYTKVGRIVTIQAYIEMSSSGNSSSVRIGGAPFNSASQGWSVGSLDVSYCAKIGGYARIEGGGTEIQLLVSSGSTSVDRLEIKGNEFGSNSYMIFTITYQTS